MTNPLTHSIFRSMADLPALQAAVQAACGAHYSVDVTTVNRSETFWNDDYGREYAIPLEACSMQVHTGCRASQPAVVARGDIAGFCNEDNCLVTARSTLQVLRIGCPKAWYNRSAVVRACDKTDERGGCAPQKGGFRRKLIVHPDGGQKCGLEYSVVHMDARYTETHVHPATRTDGLMPQSELYVVLSPEDCGRPVDGAYAPKLLICPGSTEAELKQWQLLALAPGQIVFIPPGLPHRGVDGFFGVAALPGFREEVSFDQELFDATQGGAPVNRRHVTAAE